jgi:hypothetical protein
MRLCCVMGRARSAASKALRVSVIRPDSSRSSRYSSQIRGIWRAGGEGAAEGGHNVSDLHRRGPPSKRGKGNLVHEDEGALESVVDGISRAVCRGSILPTQAGHVHPRAQHRNGGPCGRADLDEALAFAQVANPNLVAGRSGAHTHTHKRTHTHTHTQGYTHTHTHAMREGVGTVVMMARHRASGEGRPTDLPGSCLRARS